MLDSLSHLRPGRSKRVSSFDRSGKNIDAFPLKPYETLVLADIKGPGVIRRIWFTILAGGDYLRRMVLRMYWDGMEFPSVEAPVGDFFGIGHAQMGQLNTAVMSVSSIMHEGTPLGGIVCHWPMPFAKRALITMENDCDQGVMAQFYYIDYDELPSLPADQLRFHAWWNRNNPRMPLKFGDRHGGKSLASQSPNFDPQVNHTEKDNYLIADIKGRGHYVGCNLSIHNPCGGWWGEDDYMFMVDGEKWFPDLHSTGSKNYFGHAWGMQKENAFLYSGVSYYKEGTTPANINERITVYRYHVNDPIIFTKSLRASIAHGHANDRRNDYCSTAYWYQALPHKRFPKFPKLEDRLPRPDAKVHIQAMDLPFPITKGQHRSGQPMLSMEVTPQKAPSTKAMKKARRK